jgi:hypothetical protein
VHDVSLAQPPTGTPQLETAAKHEQTEFIHCLRHPNVKVEIWHRDLVVRAILKRNSMSTHGLLNACRKWNCNGTKYHYVSASYISNKTGNSVLGDDAICI